TKVTGRERDTSQGSRTPASTAAPTFSSGKGIWSLSAADEALGRTTSGTPAPPWPAVARDGGAMTRVLVAYASKMGGTKEIATAIGARLTDGGYLTDVRPVEAVDSVTGYDAVVLGSAVYAGRWRPAAARFVQRCRSQLAD